MSNNFLQRFLQGPQAVWVRIQERIFAIKNLWSVSEIEDEYLQYQKRIVGWTPNLDSITDAVNDDTLRRLIATSITLWRRRGPEDTLIDILELVAITEVRIWNWFDYRFIVGETGLSHDHTGTDPWMLAADEKYWSNLRIVDDGALDHTLVKNLVKLMRATGERWEITYINFLDEFTVDSDNAQWDSVDGTPLAVASGVAQFTDTSKIERAITNSTPSIDWNIYIATWKIQGESDAAGEEFGGGFYLTDEDNGFWFALNAALNKVRIYEYTAGAPSTVIDATYTHGTLYEDVYYAVRIHVEPEGATNRIKLYIDGDLVINTTHAVHTQGKLGIWHTVGSTIKVDDVEMFQLPMDSDTVEINP